MTNSAINLVVLRVADIDRSAQFYAALGLTFSKHRHGKGPEHCACEMPNLVFELYPQDGDSASSAGARIGFQIESIDAALPALLALGGSIVSPPKDSPWGRRAVIVDLDSHRVELTEAVVAI